MKIEEILKVTQEKEYKKLKKRRNPYKTINENLSHRDFENMMKHTSYKRGSGGAIRQVN